MFPFIGHLPIANVSSTMVYELVLVPIQETGAIEKAHRVCQRVHGIFTFAFNLELIPEERCTHTRDLLTKIPPATNQPALLDREEVRSMLRTVEALPAHPITKLANRLTALTAARANNIYKAVWSEFDLDAAQPTWSIPASKMKGGRDFQIPLCRQAVEVMLVLKTLTGGSPLVFPCAISSHKTMSSNTMLALLNRAGYAGKHCPHGWRSSFASIMSTGGAGQTDVIEFALAHIEPNKTKGAYLRGKYLAERAELAQRYADLLFAGMPSPTWSACRSADQPYEARLTPSRLAAQTPPVGCLEGIRRPTSGTKLAREPEQLGNLARTPKILAPMAPDALD